MPDNAPLAARATSHPRPPSKLRKRKPATPATISHNLSLTSPMPTQPDTLPHLIRTSPAFSCHQATHSPPPSFAKSRQMCADVGKKARPQSTSTSVPALRRSPSTPPTAIARRPSTCQTLHLQLLRHQRTTIHDSNSTSDHPLGASKELRLTHRRTHCRSLRVIDASSLHRLQWQFRRLSLAQMQQKQMMIHKLQ